MLETVRNWDYELFERINGVWTHELLNAAMPVITDLHKNSFFIVAISIFTFVLFWRTTNKKRALILFSGFVTTLALTDQLCYRVLKPSFDRPRPPNHESVQSIVRAPHGNGPGFPSNHAANSFAIALYLVHFRRRLAFLWLGLAVVISYSRVYVGVHFPGDVLLGALIGTSLGLFISKAWKKFFLNPRA